MTTLQTIGKYFNDKSIFTFGGKDAVGFLFRKPNDHKGLAVILTEQPIKTAPSLNNSPRTYRKISIQLFVESSTNNLNESYKLANEIFSHLQDNPKLEGINITAVEPTSPSLIRTDDKDSSIYVVEFMAVETK